MSSQEEKEESATRTAQFDWSASQYSKFLEERTRPASELVSRILRDDIRSIVDLGCGPGNSTAVLHERWPAASITGLDNSGDMLAQARIALPEMTFELGDIESWQPTQKYDLIFSNAALHWVEDHQTLLPRLLQRLEPGGVLAVQMPNNHNEITHRAMREVAHEGLWSIDLTQVRSNPPVLAVKDYYDTLVAHTSAIDIWETRYFHIMESVESIAEWLKGTGLRPFLAGLSPSASERFMERYIEKLRQAMPQQADVKVLMPYPRLFMVATLSS